MPVVPSNSSFNAEATCEPGEVAGRQLSIKVFTAQWSDLPVNDTRQVVDQELGASSSWAM